MSCARRTSGKQAGSTWAASPWLRRLRTNSTGLRAESRARCEFNTVAADGSRRISYRSASLPQGLPFGAILSLGILGPWSCGNGFQFQPRGRRRKSAHFNEPAASGARPKVSLRIIRPLAAAATECRRIEPRSTAWLRSSQAGVCGCERIEGLPPWATPPRDRQKPANLELREAGCLSASLIMFAETLPPRTPKLPREQ